MRRATNSRNSPKRQSLDEIHQGIKDFVSKAPSIFSEVKTSGAPTIEDALQAIETVSRPKTSIDIDSLGTTLINAIVSAGDDPQNWKLLALTIIHRRYHSKAPEAKALKAKNDPAASDGTGHGERLSFYLIIVYLQNLARTQLFANDFSLKACCTCLARLALPAGGTRDVCALVEHFVYDELDQAGILQIQKDEGDKRSLSQAVIDFVLPLQDGCDDTKVSPVLRELIEAAATLLDEDLTLIDSHNAVTSVASDHAHKKQKVCLKTCDEGKFQSTISTFIPHHDRGSKSRKLVQTIAELMIWSQTASSKRESKFSEAFANLCDSSTHTDDKIVPCVHALQTSIRRLRKKLNASSREQGFSLCSSFGMDPSSITLGMIKTAKHGDVDRLKTLATKSKNEPVMRLIANRYADPSKAVPASSMRALRNQWIRIASKDNTIDEDDELINLQLQMQEATVKATIELLRSKVPEPSKSKDGKSIIASLDGTAEGDGAAIIVAAALDARCVSEDTGTSSEHSVALHLGEEQCEVSTLPDVMNLLDRFFTEERPLNAARDEPATTKDIQNLIDRHLGADGTLLLFASSDIKLEQRVLTQLQEQGSTVHCHIVDDWAFRMERENAKVGDITVTLAWDSECDLDLHAVCPNGDHIYYGKKHGGGEKGGGYLDVDMNTSGGSMEPVENIFLGDVEKGIEAAHGTYKIYVQNYEYHGTTVPRGDPVPWRVRLSKDGQITQYTGECVGTKESSNSTVVEFEYSGRTAPLPEAVGSALVSSNLVSVTSSLGDSVDSISQLMRLREQHDELDRVRALVNDEAEKVDDAGTSPPTPVRPLMSDKKAFDITNRDRLYLNLSKLPSHFHLEVNRCFQGGSTLLQHTASTLAKRLIEDNVHIDELKRAGYQTELVDLVLENMTKFGI